MADSENRTFRPKSIYMRRAIQLAKMGEYHASPNPMVGAVIEAHGIIIGEGWHRKCGEPHAEVNAVNSVGESDLPLLKKATIYVTLEPCSHYGQTPPCAKLLIDREIPRIVVGSVDPFSKVSGRGINMLREAGREVVAGFMEKECKSINPHFFTAHTLHRPYILLKWAESADRFIAPADGKATFSDTLTMPLMHSLRARYDAIMVGTGTLLSDNPTLNTRLWPGDSPRPVIFRSKRLHTDLSVLAADPIMLQPSLPLKENMELLYARHGITSLMVEGGAKLLESFISQGLFDEIRIETSPIELHDGIKAPKLPPLETASQTIIRRNTITTYTPR